MSRCARGTFHPTAGPTGLAIVKIDQSDTSPYVLCTLITLWTSWRHGQETKPVPQPSVGKYRGHIKTLTTICSAKKLKPPAYLSVLCLVCLLAYSFLCHSIISLYASTFFQRQRSATASGVLSSNSRPLSSVARKRNGDNLTAEEARVLRQTREEYSRRGGFVRVFPTPDSWELYG